MKNELSVISYPFFSIQSTDSIIIENISKEIETYTDELFDTGFYESYDAVRYSVAKSLSKFYKEIIL